MNKEQIYIVIKLIRHIPKAANDVKMANTLSWKRTFEFFSLWIIRFNFMIYTEYIRCFSSIKSINQRFMDMLRVEFNHV